MVKAKYDIKIKERNNEHILRNANLSISSKGIYGERLD